jgi:hypothetical protein
MRANLKRTRSSGAVIAFGILFLGQFKRIERYLVNQGIFSDYQSDFWFVLRWPYRRET